jgi:hypothetical protein
MAYHLARNKINSVCCIPNILESLTKSNGLFAKGNGLVKAKNHAGSWKREQMYKGDFPPHLRLPQHLIFLSQP